MPCESRTHDKKVAICSVPHSFFLFCYLFFCMLMSLPLFPVFCILHTFFIQFLWGHFCCFVSSKAVSLGYISASLLYGLNKIAFLGFSLRVPSIWAICGLNSFIGANLFVNFMAFSMCMLEQDLVVFTQEGWKSVQVSKLNVLSYVKIVSQVQISWNKLFAVFNILYSLHYWIIYHFRSWKATEFLTWMHTKFTSLIQVYKILFCHFGILYPLEQTVKHRAF